MSKWVLGFLALGAVCSVVALTRSKPVACPACAIPAAAPVAEAPPAGPPVVDVVDLAAELDRPAADEPFVPFVPFDPPTAPMPRPVQ